MKGKLRIIDFITIIPIYATSMILGVVSFIPGGLIVTDGTLAVLLNIHGIPRVMIWLIRAF